MKHPLNEAWDGMVREGVLDSVVNSVKSALSPSTTQSPLTQQNANTTDPNKLKQIDILKQQIRDLDNKIAPLADKKRKLEEQISKIMK